MNGQEDISSDLFRKIIDSLCMECRDSVGALLKMQTHNSVERGKRADEEVMRRQQAEEERLERIVE